MFWGMTAGQRLGFKFVIIRCVYSVQGVQVLEKYSIQVRISEPDGWFDTELSSKNDVLGYIIKS
jgi:hypothetical protein